MTPDESREQKAMLLLEHQEAEDQLSNLEEKAKRISERILAVAEYLREASDRRTDISDTQIYVTRASTKMDIGRDPQIAMAMDYQAKLKLVDELRTARARVGELEKRKHALGLK
jgi:glucosamine 6-phosphate synthetase-like amidotransferase/phosphosugar isomerase protein